MNRTRIADSRTEATLPFVTSSRFVLLVAIELILIAALIAFFEMSGHAGPQLALIPTLIAVTATRFFGKGKDEDEDSEFGNHPAVAFIFGALATGEFEDVDEMIAEDFGAYANGYSVVAPEAGNGPVLFVQNINYWRKVAPDLSVVIYDEVVQKEEDNVDSIAVRFVFTGTLTSPDLEVDHDFELEAAAFIKVADHKISEYRVAVDTAFLDGLRSAMGRPLP